MAFWSGIGCLRWQNAIAYFVFLVSICERRSHGDA
ncbi:hypothetical protein SAG0021_03505 [Streptococcus agalactiae FSL S3-277]|nr:hypothetical protein SAG0021_03505 [Streptococcus agalactiae FSL S3-277]